MARRTAREIYADLTAAGFTPAAAVTMTAIALAESGGDDTARGDLGLQTETWGPSYGLYQIRTLKADTGRGTDRDITALTSDAAQARAAYSISHGGSDFSPWSTFTSGRWRDFVATVQAAVGVPAASTGGTTDAALAGWSVDPRQWPTEAIAQARPLLLEGVAVVLGLALVGVGLARAMQPTIRRQRERARKAATTAASVAVLA